MGSLGTGARAFPKSAAAPPSPVCWRKFLRDGDTGEVAWDCAGSDMDMSKGSRRRQQEVVRRLQKPSARNLRRVYTEFVQHATREDASGGEGRSVRIQGERERELVQNRIVLYSDGLRSRGGTSRPGDCNPKGI